MRQKRIHFVFALLLAFIVVLAFTSCEKLSVNKLRANYHFSKANHLFTDGKFRKAMTEYENTLKYNPDLIQAYRFLGESYKSLYKIGVDTPENMEIADKALDAFKKAYEAEPDNKEIIFSLGDMYDKLKNFEEAEKLYLRILELEPGNMGNYYVVASSTRDTPPRTKPCGPRPNRCTCGGSNWTRRTLRAMLISPTTSRTCPPRLKPTTMPPNTGIGASPWTPTTPRPGWPRASTAGRAPIAFRTCPLRFG
jgi:tetratricopeptide (TPR) repeat protein